MKRICFFIFIFLIVFSNVFGQKKKVVTKPKSNAKVVLPATVEIPENDWYLLNVSVSAEDWKKVEQITLEYLKKLPSENSKKQVAQLRYIYIFALQGQVANGDLDFEKLDEILQTFIGKDFLMPSRQISKSCKNILNYICPSENKENSLWIAATNSKGTVIHSFEYFQLNETFDIEKNKNRIAFSSGTLQEFTLNPRKTNTWIARLYFNNSQIAIIN
jgi:hypothetical protein